MKSHAIINQTNPDIINKFGIIPEKSLKKTKSEKQHALNYLQTAWLCQIYKFTCPERKK